MCTVVWRKAAQFDCNCHGIDIVSNISVTVMSMRRATSHTSVLQVLTGAMLVAVVFGTAPDASVAQPAAALDWERRTAQAQHARAEQRARIEQSRAHAQMPSTMYASTPDPSPPPHPFPLEVNLKSTPERSDAPARARSAARVGHRIALFPAASRWAEGGYQGFARIINRSDAAGEVRIEAFDDAGMAHGPVTLRLGAGETAHFNSEDLEGNPKGKLSQSIGSGEGDWRLELSSALDLEVLSYIRTTDGFLTAMHDVVPASETGHRVAIFNPGSNPNQVSRLRLVNPGSKAARVSIEGIDDAGESSGDAVVVTVPAGATRTVSAKELEAGGRGLTGMLGRGKGKWQLVVSSGQPIEAMSLLSSPTGHLTNLSTVSGTGSGGGHRVALFPSAARWAQRGYQGFARVINRSKRAGEVHIEAVDDAGMGHGPVTLSIGAGETVHFNSENLEEGNAKKGLPEGTGTGTGDWRLEFTSGLDIEVLAYIRTDDGFLTAMHDVAPSAAGAHRVVVFNPGSNPNQVSRLRVVNPGEKNARVRIEGVDDKGKSPGDAVEFTLPGGRSRTLTAQELESEGGRGLSGGLGTGKGKWRLAVTANQPIEVMSLLSSPTGHVTNLSTVRSTVAQEAEETAAEVFAERISGPIVQGKCIACHIPGGLAALTRLHFVGASAADHVAHNLGVFENFVSEVEDGATLILNKIQGVAHGGGVQVAAGTPEFADMERFLGLLGEGVERAPLTPQTLFDTVTIAPARKVLRRAALIFAGRIPTDGEYAAAQGGPAALRATIRGLMSGPQFHEFLIRASNDRLLTERDTIDIIDVSHGFYVDFVNETYRRFAAAHASGDRRDFYEWHESVQYGVRRAPLALIAHVVENDLPYTEILTADYIMANPMAAKIYGAPTHHFDDPEDVHEFKPSSIESYYRHGDGYRTEFDPVLGLDRVLDPGPLSTDYPHAGILSTKSFLLRYPTTATNRNRARSRWTYYHFLGLDIEKSASRTTDPVALADTNNPTLHNPACTVCHRVLDPIAGAFQNYGEEGFYKDGWGGLDSLDEFYKNDSAEAQSIQAESWEERETLSWPVSLAAGVHTLRVLYTNHFYDESTDEAGRVYLDRLRVTDARGGELASREFEDVEPPVASGGQCGNAQYNPATETDDHLVLWGGYSECALLLDVEVPNHGGYNVEVVAWSTGHDERYGGDGFAKLLVENDAYVYQEGDTWYRDMRAPGFAGELAPNPDNSVQWLAQQIIADDRFAEATVEFWWPAIMGSEVAEPPEDEEDANFEGLLLAANAQGAEVTRLANGFRGGFDGRAAYNLKDLLGEIVLSKWFRADMVDDGDPVRATALRDAGARRLLTPEELARKTEAVAGIQWGRRPRAAEVYRGPYLRAFYDVYRLLYGGIDSDGVAERAGDFTAVMAGVAKRHAAEVSCPIVTREFFLVPEAERRLFAGIDRFVRPSLEFDASFEIEAGSSNEVETLSVDGALTAGTKTVRLAFTNDYWGGDDDDRNVFLDRLDVRDSAGDVVVSLELEELPEGDCKSPYDDTFALWCHATAAISIEVPAAGIYSVEVAAWADQAGDELPRLSVSVEDANGSGAGAGAIRSKLVELYDTLLGVQVTPHSPDVEAAYHLFVDVMERGRAAHIDWFDSWKCNWDWDYLFFEGIVDDVVVESGDEYGRWYEIDFDRVGAFYETIDWSDPHHTAQAWVVVLAYLLGDYRYLYL